MNNDCPRCWHKIPNDKSPGAYPGAMSRLSSGTEVCSACGLDEAVGRGLVPESEWPLPENPEMVYKMSAGSMALTSLVLHVDGSITDLLLDNGPDDLRKMNAAVGGYIEMVALNDELIIYCNEEGMLMNLPDNPMATELLHRFGLGNVTSNGYLQGDVLLVGNDGTEYTSGVPLDWRETLRSWGFPVPLLVD